MCMNDCKPKVENASVTNVDLKKSLLKDALLFFNHLNKLTEKEKEILFIFLRLFYQDGKNIREHIFNEKTIKKFKKLKNKISNLLKDYKKTVKNITKINEKWLSANFCEKDLYIADTKKILFEQKESEEILKKINLGLKQIITSNNPKKEYLNMHKWVKELTKANEDDTFFFEKFSNVVDINYIKYFNGMEAAFKNFKKERMEYKPFNSSDSLKLEKFMSTIEEDHIKTLKCALSINAYAEKNNISKNINNNEFNKIFAPYIKDFKQQINKNAKFVKKTLNDLLICQPNDLYSTKEEYLKTAKKCVNAEKLYRTFVAKLTKIDNNLNITHSFDTFIINSFDILMKFECAGVGLTSFNNPLVQEKIKVIYFGIFTAVQISNDITLNAEKNKNCFISKEDIENIIITLQILELENILNSY